ncbi:MAG: Fic family protein [Pseudomonadota bacterium]|nr:Fic family protein [Pseudomonadota bacterium]
MAPAKLRSRRWIWQRPNWPIFTWDDAALSAPLSRARRAQGELAGVARLLDSNLDLSAQLEVLTLEGLMTSAIEGEKLNPDSLRSSLARRLGLPTAGLPPASRAVEGLVEVLLDATQRYNQPLTLKRLNAWQAALFPTGRSGLSEIRVGNLRGEAPMQIVSGPIGRERVHYQAPPRARLERDMRTFLKWFNDPPTGLDGLLRAGVAHAWFEILHPYEDGNGRVGRALLDLALATDERRVVRLYSMSARFMDQRDAYYAALECTSSGDLDITRWLLWFLEQVEAAIRSNESLIAAVVQKARFWMRHSQDEINERQLKALNRMLDAEPGGFVGGMTNKKYSSLTKASPATAQRDLSDLVKAGCLSLVGSGRGARYEIKFDADGESRDV